eukprot:2735629-Amphidinium_carterae.1
MSLVCCKVVAASMCSGLGAIVESMVSVGPSVLLQTSSKVEYGPPTGDGGQLFRSFWRHMFVRERLDSNILCAV